MPRRNLWAVLTVLALAPAAPAQSIQATFVTVEKADRANGTLVAKGTFLEYRAVTERIVVTVNGQNQVREVVKTVPVEKTTTITLPLKGMKGYSGDGKAVAEKELWERLKPGVTVVLGDVRLARPPFVNLFRPEALLLLGDLPAAAAPTPLPVPAPAPLPVPPPK
jgi:hypothetical protein